jgi:hypothetical protein
MSTQSNRQILKPHPWSRAFSAKRLKDPACNKIRLPKPFRTEEEPEVLEFRAGQILKLLEVAAERGCSVYDLTLPTELDAQGVLDAVRALQTRGCRIRAKLDYAGNLELFFILLETQLPDIPHRLDVR